MNLPHCSILVLLGRTAWGCPRSRGLPWSSWPRDNSAPAVWSPSPPTWPARVTLRCAAPWNQVTDGNSAGFLACRFTCDIWASVCVCFFVFVGVSHEQCSRPPLFRDHTIKYIVDDHNPSRESLSTNRYKGTTQGFRTLLTCACFRTEIYHYTYSRRYLPDLPMLVPSFVPSFVHSHVRTSVHTYTHPHTHTIHI